MQVETRYAKTAGGNIAYQVVGDGPVDLIYVPCWISHLDTLWEEPRFVRFVERTSSFSRIILFDKQGTGLSDPAPALEPPTLEQLTGDLLAVLDAAGSARAVLLGFSLGSVLAALFAAFHPDRTAALVVYGGVAKRTWSPDYPWAPTDEEHERYRDRIAREWGGPFDLESFAPSSLGDERFRAWWASYLRRSASPAAALAVDRFSAEIDIRPALPSIRVPTLVLHRAGDRFVNVGEGRYLAARIPSAAFVELPGNDHIPFVGDQDALLDEIESFVTGARPAPRVERTLATVLVAEVVGATHSATRPGSEARGDTDYQALVLDTLARFHGRASTEPTDGVVATFDGPARAIRCATALADGARRLGLRQRAGLHTGEVEIRGTAVGGLAVHVASRIAAHARPGDVLTSGIVKDLVAGTDLVFGDVGDHALPGLPAEWNVYRVGRDTRPAVVTVWPPTSPPETLPAVATSLLSPREREVAALLARGLSNRQVASELTISVATAERHVANILTKLGHRSRAQVAAWAAGQAASGPYVAGPA